MLMHCFFVLFLQSLKYFKDEKLSLIEKSKIWLLCSDNQIVWIIGKRQDDRFKITKQTTKILQINFTNE